MSQNSREVTVLLVEDDDGDMKLVQRAFKKAHIANTLVRAVDGIEALDMLRGTNGKPRIARPFIVFADINMPRMDGLTLVRTLREDSNLKDTIVFMLTTSKHEDDKNAAYDLNVAGYILKENAGYDFLDLMSLVGGYSRVVELP
ncbi:MAG: response regulator [Rhodomicrobiaceae bacterium]